MISFQTAKVIGRKLESRNVLKTVGGEAQNSFSLDTENIAPPSFVNS